ncbi:MAG: SHOCT domain-containing protein [Nitrospinaceae bacterium]|nr:SHOCT domain-containing protein [Nitrospinaceae bacterium]
MKPHRHTPFMNYFLTLVLAAGLVSGCASTPEKRLKKKGFTLSYKSKVSAGAAANKMQLHQPLKISEVEMRMHLKTLTFEELSLFGKKRSVFTSKDIGNMARLLAKALRHVPSNKIIHYELEAAGGLTSGNIFASKDSIHWQFNSIKGMRFSGRVSVGWGNSSWRMVPQSGQKFQVVGRVMGNQAQENWIFSQLRPFSQAQQNAEKKSIADRPSNKKPAIKEPSGNSASKRTDPALEEKLGLLKNLYEKNLIDEKEYEQKRNALLDSYF